MVKVKKFLAALIACVVIAGGLATVTACNPESESGNATGEMKSASIIVTGNEGGANVSGVVAEFNGKVSGFDKDTFTVTTGTSKRTVTKAYSSDAKGNESSAATAYVTLEFEIPAGSAWGNTGVSSTQFNPFSYDMTTGFNGWSTSYKVQLVLGSDKSIKLDGKTVNGKATYSYTVNPSETTNRICPQLDGVWGTDKYTYTSGNTEIKLNRGWYKPEGATGSGGKYPLIVWLHGQGEGSHVSDDVYIDLLGNEVSALGDTAIQSYFAKGAYVLAVQSPTMWMDMDGNITSNVNATEGQPSYYTEALFAAIKDYVDKNNDIDADRVYLGGCSNGGYMTMNMAFTHGDYFAAYYPVCEAYMDSKITDDMIAQLKDYNMWFVLSQNDTTVNPANFSVPTYYRLLEAGADNVHMYMSAKVIGNDTGTPVEYMGHFSWIYVFNNEVKKEFDNSAVTGTEYLTAANCTKDGNMWTWMAQQTKAAPAQPVETYEFEAEKGAITDGKAMGGYWDQTANQWVQVETDVKPTVESAKEYAAEGTGADVTSVGYFSGNGTAITWEIYAEEECDVTLTLRAASAVQSMNEQYQITGMTAIDLSQGAYVKLYVNGEEKTLTGTLPGLTQEQLKGETVSSQWGSYFQADASNYHNYGEGTVTVHLNKGKNTVKLATQSESGGVNVDKLTVSGTEVKLSYVPVDNSDRIPQQG